jgi:hypothetical protein
MRFFSFLIFAAALAACGQQNPPASSPVNPASALAETAHARCTFHQDTPPKCSDTGAFRRFYTSPGASYMSATWSPVSNAWTLPSPLAGILYVEGWPTNALSGSSTEAGFKYDPVNGWFVPFQKTLGKAYWYSNVHFAVAQLSVQLYGGATCPNARTACAVASYSGTCYGSTSPCNATHTVSATGWVTQACCVLASMIAIAEPPPGRVWKNGAVFGPIAQSVCALAGASPGGCEAPGLVQAAQSFPTDGSRVIVRDKVPGLTGSEIDTIDLHP